MLPLPGPLSTLPIGQGSQRALTSHWKHFKQVCATLMFLIEPIIFNTPNVPGVSSFCIISPTMALTPTYINLISFFYPFGNTPAVDLTQELLPESSAEVLLLGCGDVRNILFTAYSNNSTQRFLDFTSCDHETALHGKCVDLLN